MYKHLERLLIMQCTRKLVCTVHKPVNGSDYKIMREYLKEMYNSFHLLTDTYLVGVNNIIFIFDSLLL